jgi:hypothetical protein
VGLRAGLDTMAKREIPSPCWDSNPRSSSPLSTLIMVFNSKTNHFLSFRFNYQNDLDLLSLYNFPGHESMFEKHNKADVSRRRHGGEQ